MKIRTDRLTGVFVSLLALLLPLAATAQVTTTGDIRGSVLDPSGAAIPATELKLVNEATGIERSTVSTADGGFVFLALPAGTYKITATAKGFQTAVSSGITVETARTTDVSLRLAVGAITEQVEVKDVAAALETSSTTISTTVKNNMIQNLPLRGRDLLSFGLLTAGAQRGSSDRSSTFNGLPNASLNITLDGINDNSQRFKSGGTSNFVFAPLRLGAIEEVTVSTSGMSADASGTGAMQLRFVTKKGTNDFHGSAFEQFRNNVLNANSWFNNAAGLPTPRLRLNEYGGSLGGPIFRNRLFFFVNYEELRNPSQSVINNTMLTPEAQQGIFRYADASGTVHTANVLQIAGAAGFPSQIDPAIAQMLSRMNSAVSAGSLTGQDLFRNRLQWNRTGGVLERYPTASLDYQITPTLSWSGSWNLRWRDIRGTQRWPGESFQPESEFISTYFIVSSGLNWAIRPTILNEFRAGVQGNPEMFNAKESISKFNFNGRYMQVNFPLGIPLLVGNTLPSPDNNPVYNVYDNLNVVRGPHTYTFGGSLLHTSNWEANFGGGNSGGVPPSIPQFSLGVVSSDPVASALSSANLPGIRSDDLSNAWALYALLTGRLSNITNSRAVDEKTHQYQDFSPFVRREAMTTWGLYFKDSWRARHNLTFNYGLRWEFTGDNHNTNGVYTSPTPADLLGPSTSLFAPGVLNGNLNPQIEVRPKLYNRDYVNPAPSFGFAWNPRQENGALGKLLGGNRTVVRGSFAIAYYQEGLLPIEQYASWNPGLMQSLFLSPGMTGFNPGGLSVSGALPALNTFPAAFAPSMPQSLFTFSGNDLSTVNMNLHSPYVTNWMFGIQREIASRTVIEVRYVGNKGTHLWHGYNQNEVNIFENGFLNEFKNAQNNLAINKAAGVTSFAYAGLPGQAALPIFDAAFGARGGQPALGAASGYGNGTFITELQQGQAGALAAALAGSPTYLCRMVGNALSPCAGLGYNAAGPYPMNFFQPNPFNAGGNLMLMNDYSYSSYNALQLEFRRTSGGLTFNASYTYGKSLGDFFAESDIATLNYTTLRNRDLNKGPSVFDIRHTGVAYVAYDLPFGAGHKLAGNSIVNRFIGGWSLSSIMRLQSGRPFLLTSGRATVNQYDSGVILNGMTTSELQNLMSIGPGPRKNISFVDSTLVGSDGRANPSILSVPTTPGQFGQNIYLYGPGLFMMDMALGKDIPVTEKIRMSFQAEALNVLNHPVFMVGGQGATVSITSTTFGQTSRLAVDPRNIQLRLNLKF
jgi:hypothetical protein